MPRVLRKSERARLPAFLYFVAALVLGGWSAVDFNRNQDVKQAVSLALDADLASHSLGIRDHQDLDAVLEEEKYDAFGGVMAIAFLATAVVSMARAKQTVPR